MRYSLKCGKKTKKQNIKKRQTKSKSSQFETKKPTMLWFLVERCFDFHPNDANVFTRMNPQIVSIRSFQKLFRFDLIWWFRPDQVQIFELDFKSYGFEECSRLTTSWKSTANTFDRSIVEIILSYLYCITFVFTNVKLFPFFLFNVKLFPFFLSNVKLFPFSFSLLPTQKQC